MATERLSMRQTREILRQKWRLGRPHREVAQSLGISTGAVGTTVLRARAAGLDWAQVDALSDEGLEARVYGPPTPPTRHRPVPDCAYLHAERRKPGVTLELLHLEYLEQHPDGYRYTQFCEVYRRWLKRRGLSMRQVHRAGEKLFVDYAGQKPSFIDPATGERITAELFVAVLGASNYTYAEATLTQQVPDWIASHQRAFAFLGGVTTALVCDQLKSGVVIPCRYEPGLQRTYEEFAQHYGTVILPARPAKARDKAKVEVAVQVAERWILARLRHEKPLWDGECVNTNPSLDILDSGGSWVRAVSETGVGEPQISTLGSLRPFSRERRRWTSTPGRMPGTRASERRGTYPQAP